MAETRRCAMPDRKCTRLIFLFLFSFFLFHFSSHSRCGLGFRWFWRRHDQCKRLAAAHEGNSSSYLTCIFLQFNFIVVCDFVNTIFYDNFLVGFWCAKFETLCASEATLCRSHKLSLNRSTDFLCVGRICTAPMGQ